MVRSLVVAHDHNVATKVATLLSEWNGLVDIVGSIEDANEAIRHFNYDLALFDRSLPDGDPLRFIKALVTMSERPAIIILDARGGSDDIADGLDSGADDYLTKPFDPRELLARIRAVLRRPRPLPSPLAAFGNIEIEVGTSSVLIAGRAVQLRRGEALLLEALLLRRDRVVSRETLLRAIYGFDDSIESNSLEAQLSRLRRRLSQNGSNVSIRSIRGIGYILSRQEP
jgi:DNA-binding response OmpR family regulator